MNCNNMIQPAVITATLAAGSAASPYYAQVNISQRLCYKTCADVTPVFNPQFSFVSLEAVGTNQYVLTVNVQGIISYALCNGGCCTKQQPINQNFTIPIYSTTALTGANVTAGNVVNSVAASPCQKCSRAFVSETPLTITTTAAG